MYGTSAPRPLAPRSAFGASIRREPGPTIVATVSGKVLMVLLTTSGAMNERAREPADSGRWLKLVAGLTHQTEVGSPRCDSLQHEPFKRTLNSSPYGLNWTR